MFRSVIHAGESNQSLPSKAYILTGDACGCCGRVVQPGQPCSCASDPRRPASLTHEQNLQIANSMSRMTAQDLVSMMFGAVAVLRHRSGTSFFRADSITSDGQKLMVVSGVGNAATQLTLLLDALATVPQRAPAFMHDPPRPRWRWPWVKRATAEQLHQDLARERRAAAAGKHQHEITLQLLIEKQRLEIASLKTDGGSK